MEVCQVEMVAARLQECLLSFLQVKLGWRTRLSAVPALRSSIGVMPVQAQAVYREVFSILANDLYCKTAQGATISRVPQA